MKAPRDIQTIPTRVSVIGFERVLDAKKHEFTVCEINEFLHVSYVVLDVQDFGGVRWLTTRTTYPI